MPGASLGQADASPLSQGALDDVPNNLPRQLTSFVGRDHDLAEARRLLGRSRLMTLRGPGGSGKTRLSIQLAAEVGGDFPDGVYFVPLAAVREPELVPSSDAQRALLDGCAVAPRTRAQRALAGARVEREHDVRERSPANGSGRSARIAGTVAAGDARRRRASSLALVRA